MTMVSLVVMEPGSEWPGHLGDSVDLIAFSMGGEALLHKTEEKLDALRREQHDVRVAVLACNEEADAQTGTCRAKVARTLLAAVTRAKFGRLVLTASSRASLRVRHELLLLAGALSEQLRGTTATVSLKFTEASRG